MSTNPLSSSATLTITAHGDFDSGGTSESATVIVDAKAVLFLLGTEMDVKTDKFASTFVFRNPNETDACGCGESVTIVPAGSAEE